MCGIVGYIGFRRADRVIVSSLKRLEYRGYDSWGLAISDGGELKVFKRVGGIGSVDDINLADSGIGVGHTRWATHGKPSEVNAHPHMDCSGKIAVVHNGIISNFQILREELERNGHEFRSETDTEVIPHLIEEYMKSRDFEKAVFKVVDELEGSYAFVAVHAGEDKLVACRYKSPLILGVGDGEIFLASDVPAVLEYTNRVVYLEDGDVVIVDKNGFEIYSNGKRVERKAELVPWSIEDAEKGGYEHFMLKEIHENPRVVEDTLIEYLRDDIEIDAGFFAGISDILIVACGTSYHAGLVGKYLIEKFAGIPVRVEYASEFNYHPPPLSRTLVIGITQSGETADTLEAMRRGKKLGMKILAITNVLGSTATRVADYTVYTRAGPEIGVAATKTFIAQLIVLYLIALKLSAVPKRELEEILDQLRLMPQKIRQILDREDEILSLARRYAGYENIMYVGRGIGYPVALEGALKLKEISYIHAEGYPAGELKHGPFALLGEKTPVVACVVKDETFESMLGNLKEIKARDSKIIAVCDEDVEIEAFADDVIRTPAIDPILAPITHSVALQLFAYHVARLRGCEIDKPRNLAKSVTVE
ncbi:glutamine--fructose-6-phosphate transaminase (isomerizing) [Archaeoglobus neptunius]|uniref:glutamine--fructose-6-phosphate transaminase (isomerizing) n=1 Tax=Archaeoglobus neptunius TaxID=2798580 RepID=UPI0019290671|nr:glutamine--fructose-6-phosphate transaminase (isomerizing) [Archaeoglobus neptunius]